MPRRSKGPYLYRDTARKQWVVRDGSRFIRTGCAENQHEEAQRFLAEYIGQKYRPAPSPTPLIADMLIAYNNEHLPTTRAAKNSAYNVANLTDFWGPKRIGEVTPANCREYAKDKTPSAARRDLEVLRAAIGYWHKFYGPLAVIPTLVLPPKAEPRERWLTAKEQKRLRKAAMAWPHLYRFVILGLKTGTRSGSLLALQWDWIDLKRGVMLRRAPGQAESKKRTPPVRLGKSLVRLLRLWKRRDKAIKHVIHYDGQPIKKLRRSWAAACKAAKIKGASPHTLRHTRATMLMQAGVAPWEAAGHLGMSVEMLQRVYGKHSPDFQSNAAEV